MTKKLCLPFQAHVLVVHTHKLLVTELQSVIAVEDDEMISVSPSEGYTEQSDFTRNKGTIANIFGKCFDKEPFHRTFLICNQDFR